jgi:hypothetical protein
MFAEHRKQLRSYLKYILVNNVNYMDFLPSLSAFKY